MEFICELILEVVLEGIFGLTVHNPKAKTWVKTATFLVISEAVAGLVLWLSFAAPAEAGDGGAITVRVIAAALAVGFLIAAVYGHKRDWRQE